MGSRAGGACPRGDAKPQVDRDLRVLDAPGGAGVLALHARRGCALLEVSRLIHDRHRARVAQVLDDIAAQFLTRQHTAR